MMGVFKEERQAARNRLLKRADLIDQLNPDDTDLQTVAQDLRLIVAHSEVRDSVPEVTGRIVERGKPDDGVLFIPAGLERIVRFEAGRSDRIPEVVQVPENVDPDPWMQGFMRARE